MKTSEMIAMLENDPKLRFTSGGEKSTMEAICRSGNIELYYIPAELKYEFRSDRDWQLVREPVTWQEALQAWVDGKTIKCEYPPNDMKLISTTFFPKNLTSTPTREALITGTWYIE